MIRETTRWGWLMAVAILLAGCPGDDDQQGGPPPGMMGEDEDVVVTVETVEVERGDFRVTADYAGEVRSEGMTELSPEVSGRLVDVEPNVGSTVSEGEVLARIDDTSLRQNVRELEASLRVAESNVEEARVNLENLESDLERKRPLVDRDMVSEREIEELQNSVRSAEQQLNVAESRVQETQARLESARQDLRNTEIRAPFEGKIAMRHVDRGTYVGPEQPIFSLVDDGDLYLSIDVPERQAANVHADTPATVRVGALGHMELAGDIERISPSIDSTTRSMRVDVVVDEPDELQLRPGMYARVTLELGHRDDALTVDNQALSRTSDGTPYLWRVVDDEARRVEFSSLGLQGSSRTEIVEDLQEDDRIVLRGQQRLEEGVAIRDLDSEAPDDLADAPPESPEET